MLSLAVLLLATPAVLGKTHADDDMVIVEAKSSPPRRHHILPYLDISAKNQPCVTNDGRSGRCTTLNTCYPYFRLARFKVTEQWVMGTINTCKAQRRNINYIYGVCCPYDQPETRSIGSKPQYAEPVYDIHSDDFPFIRETFDSSFEVDEDFPFENDGGWRNFENFTYENYYSDGDDPPPDYPSPLGGTDRLSSDLMTKILNGRVARKNKYPFMAALMNKGQFFCGGSLITNRHVLTAAHCVAFLSAFDIDNITIRLGDHNLKRSHETRHAVRRVRRIVRNKTFNTSTLHGDIAIIQMRSRVKLKRGKIETICLEQAENKNHVGNEATVAGWGALKYDNHKSAVLREVDVRVWNNTECGDSYGSKAPGGIVHTMLCASKPEEGKDSCLGDSGGPLFNCDSKNSNCRQIGIVSWGVKCGEKEYPGVYTNVAKYKDWINGYMANYATGREKVFCIDKNKAPERLSVTKAPKESSERGKKDTTIRPKIRPSSFG